MSRSLTPLQVARVIARVEATMEAESLNQSGVARRLGVAQQTISTLINDRRLGYPAATAIARNLGIPIEHLLGTPVPGALELVLRDNRGRWNSVAVAAVLKMAHDHADVMRSYGPGEWEQKLDEVDSVLAPILREIGRRRGR